MLDESNRSVGLRGVALRGLERAAPRGPDFAAAATPEEIRLVAAWGANAVVVPIAQDLALHGSGLAGGGRYLEAIDQTIKAASAEGLYTILQLSQLHSRAPTGRTAAGLEYDPAVPDPTSIHLWGYLAQRYSREPAVLFDLFAHPRDPNPLDSTAALLPRLDWGHWRRWLLAMLGELRRGHPRSLAIIRAVGTDLSSFPLTYTDESQPANVLYALDLRPDILAERIGELAAFARRLPLSIAPWRLDGGDLSHVASFGPRLARAGLHWFVPQWSGGGSALVEPRRRQVRPTRLGRAVARAFAQPPAPEDQLDPALREHAYQLAAASVPSATVAALATPAAPPPAPADRYGGYPLQRGDRDAGNVYGGTARTAAAGDTLPAPGATLYVTQLQRDLRELGFALVGTPDGSFGPATQWAVREFQIYAKMNNLAQEVAPGAGTPPRYVDRLTQVPNPPLSRYAGAISGLVNPQTRAAISQWLSSRWRCPVVFEAWNMSGGARSTLAATNLWRHDDFANPAPRMFVRDFSDRFAFPATHASTDLVITGDFQTYLTWSGPHSGPPQHTWTEAELLPERLVGTALAGLSAAAHSTYKVVRAASEVECLGFFDSLNAYDNALVSLGPCHWTLGIISGGVVNPGELPGYLAYLKQTEPAAFAQAVSFFGIQPDQDWLDAAGIANGQPLFNKGERKYLGWLQVQRDDGSWTAAPTAEAEANYLKTWHWFYRYQMAGRTIDAFRTRMWDMARVRLRDVLAAPWGAGIPAVPDGLGGTRAASIGDVFTSERAAALILRWHIRFPAHVVSGGNAGNRLRAAFAHSGVSTATDPTQWSDADEVALIAGIMQEVGVVANADFTQTMNYVHNWPTWATGSNPRHYALAPTIGAHATIRGSFDFDDTGLPTPPSYT